jgi:hypothetical protein
VKIKIVAGDWSDDGHGKTESVNIETDSSADEVEIAYKKGVKKTKFDIRKFCDSFDDNIVPSKKVKSLFEHGFTEEGLYLDPLDPSEDSYCVGADSYIAIYLALCKIGGLDFTVDETKTNEVRIGGYGCF